MTQAELNQLVAALRQRQWPALSDDQVDALLSWLSHSRRNPAVRRLEELVGPAGCDNEVFDAVLSMLDVLLFDAESLHIRLAGVGPEVSRDGRRRRYRLLMSAFHPDRYPGRAEWLTARSQIITRSYARFKSEPDDAPDEYGLTVAAPQRVQPGPFRRPPVYKGISPESPKSDPLHEKLARDRFLAHKVVGVLSLLVILPLISILLDRTDPPGITDYSVAESGTPVAAPIPAPFVDWPLPEAETVEWSGDDPDPILPVQAALASPVALDWPEPPATDSPAWLRSAIPAGLSSEGDRRLTDALADTATGGGMIQSDLIRRSMSIVEDTASRMAEVMALLPDDQDTRVINALPRLSDRSVEQRPAPDADPRAEVSSAHEPSATDAPVEEPASGQSSAEGRLAADISDSDPARDPVREQDSDQSSAGAVAAVAANEPAARSSEGAEDTPNPMEPLQSQLALGPLANHPAGRLLDSYHESIEGGDLAGLLDMVAPNAVEAGLGDRSAFEASYRELFESSRERGLTLKVLHARRQDRGWLVRTDYQLEMVRSDSGDVERVRREVEYSMTEDNGRLRIAAISY